MMLWTKADEGEQFTIEENIATMNNAVAKKSDSKFNLCRTDVDVNPTTNTNPDNESSQTCIVGFKILNGDGVWCGLTTEKKFAKGYKMKGLMYGGNLSNGSGLLSSHWGPPLKAGDELVVVCRKCPALETKLCVFIYLNSVPLGLAFRAHNPQEPVHPVVSFPGKGKESVKLLVDLDPSLYPCVPRSTVSVQINDIVGTWVLKNCEQIDEPTFEDAKIVIKKCTPSQDDIMEIEIGDTFHINIKVCNSISFRATRSFESGQWTATPCQSTMMMAHPEHLANVESNMIKLVEGLQSIIRKDEDLIMFGDNISTLWCSDRPEEMD
eukprot:Awhi_evm1s14679